MIKVRRFFQILESIATIAMLVALTLAVLSAAEYLTTSECEYVEDVIV